MGTSSRRAPSGEPQITFRDRGYRTGRRGVILAPGYGATADVFLGTQFARDPLDLTDAGFVVTAQACGGTSTWGNAAAVTAMDEAVGFLLAQEDTLDDKVSLYGGSEGCLDVLNYALAFPAKVDRIVLNLPAVSLQDLHDNRFLDPPANAQPIGPIIDTAHGAATAVQRLAPSSAALTNLNGDVTRIQDDPDSYDGNWLTATANNVNTTAVCQFPAAAGTLKTGAGFQEMRVALKKAAALNSGNPTVVIAVYEGATLIAQTGSISVASGTGQVNGLFWDASTLVNKDGRDVECRVIGTAVGGGTLARNAVDVGAVEWNANYLTAPNLAPRDPNTTANRASLAAFPIQIHYSTNDLITVPSVAEAFAAAVGAELVSLGAVGHDGTSRDSDRIRRFLAGA